MPDDGFATFLADARSLDSTVKYESACRAFVTLQGARSLRQLRNADLNDDEWRVVHLATRGFLMRLERAESRSRERIVAHVDN
jgi:hypothetical protein